MDDFLTISRFSRRPPLTDEEQRKLRKLEQRVAVAGRGDRRFFDNPPWRMHRARHATKAEIEVWTLAHGKPPKNRLVTISKRVPEHHRERRFVEAVDILEGEELGGTSANFCWRWLLRRQTSEK